MKLSDRLTAESGVHYLPAMQALVRFPLEQARRDREAGLRIGTFISGYPGSPLAGYDLALSRIPGVLTEHDVSFVPAGNEEQAVTAHMGTQMLDDHPHEKWDGVTGIWYGKGPGVDRSGDALKHGNFAGTSTHGAVVILSGEDHEAKSSTMPYQQEYAFVSAGIPVLFPSSVAEFRSMGLHAITLSRYSGCWVALKLTTALCDSATDVEFAPGDVPVTIPDLAIDGEPFRKRTDFSFFPGKNIEMERHLYQEKHLAVQAYARANGLDRVVLGGGGGKVGIVAAGKAFADVTQALSDLGLEDDALSAAGVRLLKLGLIYPLDAEVVRRFAEGLDTLVVVEEKRDFLEQQIRAALQGSGTAVRVVGKLDIDGRPLFPVHGGFDADLVAERLHRLFERELPQLRAGARTDGISQVRERSYVAVPGRTPNFCSGCPHSSSTRLAPGQVAFGAPGCHCFNTVIEQPERHIDVMTQLGGEGNPWVGLSRYTERPHLVQHLGDGALYHSSYLNIRWAVAAGVNITFKILYNGAVANTGAQDAVGARGVAELTRGLASEGVGRIVVLTKTPAQYNRKSLGPGVQVRPAHRMVDTAAELAEVEGCTVMLYDESCANERRRLQKRGKLARPTTYVMVNERVCENCGDCGRASNCMSLQKTPTEFGAKTRIHTSSCNQDFSCLEGDCPAFVTVETKAGTGYRPRTPAPLDAAELPAAARPGSLTEPFGIYLPGVGGTGVLTLNGILSVAALLDGYEVNSYDQTGAAQKWGPVISSLRIAPRGARPSSAKISVGQADLYLALDELSAASPSNLDRCDPERTVVVANTDLFPTGEQIRDISTTVPLDEIRESLDAHAKTVHTVRARWIADELFGDYMLTNTVALGTAYQLGLLPISDTAIESAIELNGVAVEQNRLAFRYGRLWAADPGKVMAMIAPAIRTADEEAVARSARLPRRWRGAYDELVGRTSVLGEESRRALAIRIADLIDYAAGTSAATQYVDTVLRVADAERAVSPESEELTLAVVRNLYKLTAYKDEYEVARLMLDSGFSAQVEATFSDPVRISYNLHPPAARLIGRDRKLRLGPWFRPAFVALRAARRVRGTMFDPFARQQSRAEERGLLTWYEGLIEEVLPQVRATTMAVAVSIAELPDEIRGYESIKSANAAVVRERAEVLRDGLRRPRLPLAVVN